MCSWLYIGKKGVLEIVEHNLNLFMSKLLSLNVSLDRMSKSRG